MRKNSPRRWLHATLDLLPVILIPVFMIYSHRHTIDSYSVTRLERENQPYNFYQGVKNGKPLNTTTDIELRVGEYVTLNNGYLGIEPDIETGKFDIYFNTELFANDGDCLYLSFNCYAMIPSDYLYNIELNDGTIVIEEEIAPSESSITSYIVYVSESIEYINIYGLNNIDEGLHLKDLQLFNLTTIFGSGNEPTKEQFESMLTQDYYNFGNNYIDNYVTISKTYNDTDIMSQFTYNLYNSVDKYFNMGNVFGMNNVYLWVEMNIFHGTAPLYIYIVWNIILYEFVMDLLFLLYALFMWFIDVTKRLIEKPLDSIK